MTKLKQVIKRKGLKQCWLARKMDIRDSIFSSWSTGQSLPPPGRVAELAAILDVSPAEICDNGQEQEL